MKIWKFPGVDMSVNVSDTKDSNKRMRLVLGKSDAFTEIRCECGALLYRELIKSKKVEKTIEIKCRRCHRVTMN